MAGKKNPPAPPAPPSPEAREEVLTIIRKAAEPMLAKPLVKLLSPRHRVAEADLEQVLDELVVAGALFAVAPKTAKAKRRYWGRDPRAVARAAVLEAIANAAEPLPAKKLASQLKTPIKFAELELTQLLNEQAAAGALHVIPGTTAKGPPRYWQHDALEFGRREVLKMLDAKGPQTLANLKKAAKGLDDSRFQQVVQGMIAGSALWRHPPLGKAGKELFGRKPPSPEPYLREIGTQLAKSIAQLVEAKVPQEDLRRAVVQVVEAAGVRFTASSSGANNGAPPTDAPRATRMEGGQLIELMKEIEPGAERGALVASRDLRRAARLEKSQFDECVLDLARQGRLSLHRHDYVASLSPVERDELVTDGNGTYYVGMALPQR